MHSFAAAAACPGDHMKAGFGLPATALTWRSPKPLPLEGGGELPAGYQLAFNTYGMLNEAGTNCAIVGHSLTSNSCVDEWWGPLLGVGAAYALDTSKYFVVCVNYLGSVYGSECPLTRRPGTDVRYMADFPVTSIRDNVAAQRALLDELGVRRIALAIGGSLGGMLALEWAACYPAFVEEVVVVAAPARHSGWAIGIGEVGRQAIFADAGWVNGYYDPVSPPRRGLAVARQLAMLSYRSPVSIDSKFGRDVRPEGRRASLALSQGYGRREQPPSLSAPAAAPAARGASGLRISPDLSRGDAPPGGDDTVFSSSSPTIPSTPTEGSPVFLGCGGRAQSFNAGPYTPASTDAGGQQSALMPGSDPISTGQQQQWRLSDAASLRDDADAGSTIFDFSGANDGGATLNLSSSNGADADAPLRGAVESSSHMSNRASSPPADSRPSVARPLPLFEVESYLDYQGSKFVLRFDPLCYVRLTQMLDSHDVGRGRRPGTAAAVTPVVAATAAAAAAAGVVRDAKVSTDEGGSSSSSDTAIILRGLAQRTLVVGIDSDLLYPVSDVSIPSESAIPSE